MPGKFLSMPYLIPDVPIKNETNNLKEIARDIAIAYDARIKFIGEIIENTHKTIDDFQEQREYMSRDLKELLSRNESLRKKDFERMMADIILKQNEREMQVKKMLADFRQEEEEVAKKMRKLLDKGENARIKDFKQMMREIKREQDKPTRETNISVAEELQKMREDVYKMLDNFKKERHSVAAAWHETISFLHFHQKKLGKKHYEQDLQEKKPETKTGQN